MLLELCAIFELQEIRYMLRYNVICELVIKCQSLSSMEETYVGPLESAFVLMYSFMRSFSGMDILESIAQCVRVFLLLWVGGEGNYFHFH